MRGLLPEIRISPGINVGDSSDGVKQVGLSSAVRTYDDVEVRVDVVPLHFFVGEEVFNPDSTYQQGTHPLRGLRIRSTDVSGLTRTISNRSSKLQPKNLTSWSCNFGPGL